MSPVSENFTLDLDQIHGDGGAFIEALGEGESPGVDDSRITPSPWTLPAASLAMNLGVAAMFGQRFFKTRPVNNSIGCPIISNDDRLHALLGLSPAQLTAMKPLARDFHENIDKISSEIHAKRDRMMSMMEDDDVDMVKANQTRQDILSLQATLQQTVFEHILHMKQLLNENQKKLLFQAMRQSLAQQNTPGNQ